jgi:hypothetical protein
MIATIDREVVRENVRRLYEYNLQYSDDDDIKGDVHIVASGSVAILQKETLRMRRIEFLGLTANPLDMSIIGIDGRAEILRAVAQSLEMHTGRIVPSREQMVQRRQQQEEQQQEQEQAQQQAQEQAQEQQHRQQYLQQAALQQAMQQQAGASSVQQARRQMAALRHNPADASGAAAANTVNGMAVT